MITDKEIEKQIKESEKQARKETRLANKAKRKEEKQMSESDIVKRYVNRIIKNQEYHGRIDDEKFSGIVSKQKTVNKNLWMDTDFYFSVVFQSSEQKNKFIKDLNVSSESSEINNVQIVNGIELAKILGIELILEKSKKYPLPDIDLAGFVLDDMDC